MIISILEILAAIAGTLSATSMLSAFFIRSNAPLVFSAASASFSILACALSRLLKPSEQVPPAKQYTADEFDALFEKRLANLLTPSQFTARFGGGGGDALAPISCPIVRLKPTKTMTIGDFDVMEGERLVQHIRLPHGSVTLNSGDTLNLTLHLRGEAFEPVGV